MRDFTHFLALPATLLAFLTSSSAFAEELPWPYNLPRTSKYYPEHEALVKRELHVKEKLAWQRPLGMRKMSEDEGEKFFLDYWDFGEQAQDGNASIPLSAPLGPHFDNARSYPRLPGYSLFARQWGSCPSGYQSCTSIDRPDSCCASDAQCITVTDTGNGDVGCCAAGDSCGSTIAGCNTGAGQTECPNSGNGGCCIAGYACYDVGCVYASTQTVVTTLPTATVTTGQSSVRSSSSPTSAPGTTVGAGGAGSIYTTTVTQVTTALGSTIIQATTVTVTPTSEPSSTTISNQGPLTCSPSFVSCPASLGGGCCYSGYACGAVSCSESLTTSTEATALPPARPTTSTDTPISQASVTTETTSAVTGDACPTGFYMCSAYYLGGCCRVGRDCDTTSCPSSASTEVVSSGVTVVAPTVVSLTSTTTVGNEGTSGSAAAATQGSCANGFVSCGAAQGGGCCPSGYVCGASCTATISGVGDQPKQSPSAATAVRWAWSLGMLGLVSAVGMMCL